MRVDETIEVTAPIEEVWAMVSDPSRPVRFREGFARWRPAGGPTTGVGARYRVHMPVGSALVGGLVEVVESCEPTDLAWASITGVDHRGRWRLRSTSPGCTRVTFRISYQVPGGLLSLLVDRLSAPIVARNIRRMLRALADEVTARPVV